MRVFLSLEGMRELRGLWLDAYYLDMDVRGCLWMKRNYDLYNMAFVRVFDGQERAMA